MGSKKRKTSRDYRHRRKLSQQRWRKTRPGDAYQKIYRLAHICYEQDNRRRQKIRNHVFRRGKFELFSGLGQSNTADGSKSGASALFRIEPYQTPRDKKIVKTDALIPQLIVYQQNADIQLRNYDDCKDRRDCLQAGLGINLAVKKLHVC